MYLYIIMLVQWKIFFNINFLSLWHAWFYMTGEYLVYSVKMLTLMHFFDMIYGKGLYVLG